MKRLLYLTILLITTATTAQAANPAMAFWNTYDARKAPLNSEEVITWDTDDGHYQLVRYDLGKLTGTNKAAAPVIAAYYGYPKGGRNLPGIVHIHGGGQRASKSRVEQWVALGYACISINWGGRVLEEADTPNTDWDGLAAGFIRPGITKADELDHHNTVRPDRNTLYKEPHLLNSSWNLIALSARRALTFLEQRPEVDADKLGVEGHSMGGRSTVLTAIDPRIKAAAPSVGGSGYLYSDLWGLPGSARRMTKEDGLDLYTQVVSAQAYWPHITAPTLFLAASNDFNSPTEFVVKGMAQLPPATERIMAMAPHLNHRFTTETAGARFMWMEAHLKGSHPFPKQSPSVIQLDTPDKVPLFQVMVDDSTGLPVEKVEVYYGYARDPRIRFWRSATVSQDGNVYSAPCPVFDTSEPLFAFANITYEMQRILPRRPGMEETDRLTVSSQYQSIYPKTLQQAGTKATEKPQRVIEDFSRGWQDWYRLNANNPHHWFYATRKVLDPSWMGPKGGKLAFDITTTGAGNHLAVGLEVNTWQGYTGRRKDSYHAVVDLPKAGAHAIQLSPADFLNAEGKRLTDWDEATELTFTPANRISGKLRVNQNWEGQPPALGQLHWQDGTYGPRPYPHQPRGAAADKTVGFEDEFQQAIVDSVKREEHDEQAADDDKRYLTKEMAGHVDSFWQVLNNQSVSGEPIRVGGKTYARGLGVHAESRIRFALNGAYKTFHVVPGPDDAHHGQLEMKILVDDKQVFTTGKTRSTETTSRPALDLSVDGAQTLTLVVENADGNRGGDHASWADAYLSKSVPPKRKRIYFMAGPKSHGYCCHEYNAAGLLIERLLKEQYPALETRIYRDGKWPKDLGELADADAIVILCNGGRGHPLVGRLEDFDSLMKAGIGLACVHYAVEVPKGDPGHFMKDWLGGYFETDWSVNPVFTAEFSSFPDHPVAGGVRPFALQDEWYYHMRFQDGMKGVTPVLSTLPPAHTLKREDGPHSNNPHVRAAVLQRKEKQHVGWAYDRPDGGRGFGFTGMHFHDNWQNDDFRKILLNGIAWSAKLDIPANGVASTTPTKAELGSNRDYPNPAAAEERRAAASLKKAVRIYQSPVVTGKAPNDRVAIDIDVSGVELLYLVVGDGANGVHSDHANWVEPLVEGTFGSKRLTSLPRLRATTGWGKLEADKTASGEDILVDGKKAAFGIGVHAISMIGYELPPGSKRFKVRGVIERSAASVRFEVYDGEPTLGQLNTGEVVTQLPPDLFNLPDDLEVTAWATTPQFHNPTNIDIDHAGRIWVAEGVNYRLFQRSPRIDIKHPEGDRIMVLEDTDQDGTADKHWVFVQDKDLVAPLGVAVIDNQIVVAQPPSMLVYTDVNRNLRFDEGDTKEKFLTGFGGKDHDHSLHSVTVGPDGEWYFNTGNAGTHIVTDSSGFTVRAGSPYRGGSPSMGGNHPLRGGRGGLVSDDGHIYVGGVAFRIRPDGTGMQVIGHNFRNSYEQCVDSFGDVFQNDNDDPPACRTTWLMEYGNLGFASADGTRTWQADQRPGQSIPDAEWRQHDPGTLPAGDVYGSGGPAGIVLYENGPMEEKYGGLLLSCEVGERVIYGYYPKPQDAGFKLERFDFFKPKEDKNETYFRPSDVAIGPDGAIYVADWFDKKIGGHAMRDPGANGTIYRIAPKGRKLTTPKLDLTTMAGQIAALKSPAPNVRYLGFARLRDRGAAALPAVKALLNDNNAYIRGRAVWLLSKLGPEGVASVEGLLTHDNPRIRVTAFRALRRIDHRLLAHAANLAGDPSPAVRREVALAMRDLPLEESRDILLRIAQGFDGKDRWYLEAFGTGCTGKESALFDAVNETMGAPAEQWSERFSWIAWRLHPPQAVPLFQARAMNEAISAEQRDLALTGIAFNKGHAAADAMVDIATNGPQDLRLMADWWVRNRHNNDWREYKPADRLKPVTPTAALALPAVSSGPLAELPPISRIAAMKGNAANGKVLFNSRGTCFACHAVNGKGGQIGPDMTKIGAKFDAEVLLEAMINPSSTIAFGYESTTITKTDGSTLTGSVVADAEVVVLKDLAGQQHAVDKKDIKAREVMKQSIMPSVRALSLSPQELADLTAYLQTLK